MGVELIAEVSSNHGGDLVLAKEFIHACAEHGADWVKFQTTRVKHLNPADPQYAWFAKAELSDDAHYELKAECKKAGVKFLTTVYHADEVPFLARLGLQAIKIGSGEACDGRLRAAVLAERWRAFVSCGLVRSYLHTAYALDQVFFFRCVSRYPSPASVADGFYGPLEVAGGMWGYSDHCLGLEGCRTAIVRGAQIIEKHVQLPNQARPPKPYEATMAELKELRQFADEDPQRFIGRWQYA